jgi:hypothetical protein
LQRAGFQNRASRPARAACFLFQVRVRYELKRRKDEREWYAAEKQSQVHGKGGWGGGWGGGGALPRLGR